MHPRRVSPTAKKPNKKRETHITKKKRSTSYPLQKPPHLCQRNVLGRPNSEKTQRQAHHTIEQSQIRNSSSQKERERNKQIRTSRKKKLKTIAFCSPQETISSSLLLVALVNDDNAPPHAPALAVRLCKVHLAQRGALAREARKRVPEARGVAVATGVVRRVARKGVAARVFSHVRVPARVFGHVRVTARVLGHVRVAARVLGSVGKVGHVRVTARSLGEVSVAARVGVGEVSVAARVGVGEVSFAARVGVGEVSVAARVGVGEVSVTTRVRVSQVRVAARSLCQVSVTARVSVVIAVSRVRAGDSVLGRISLATQVVHGVATAVVVRESIV
ncbi:hypothetical protein BJ742DRAFT_50829 [Cladochytrium replicatum]|nr:hypothetical protein BJ742DRAFT_50829 [Cladochytrium replicatum]